MQPFATDHGDDQRRDRRDRRETFVQDSASSALNVVSALRRCRQPVPARVAVADGRPVAVTTDRRGFAGGRVLACAGPWRTSGQWWEQSTVDSRQSTVDSQQGPHADYPSARVYARARGTAKLCQRVGVGPHASKNWNRDEWDVTLSDGAVYRMFKDRVTDGWFIDAIAD